MGKAFQGQPIPTLTCELLVINLNVSALSCMGNSNFFVNMAGSDSDSIF